MIGKSEGKTNVLATNEVSVQCSGFTYEWMKGTLHDPSVLQRCIIKQLCLGGVNEITDRLIVLRMTFTAEDKREA